MTPPIVPGLVSTIIPVRNRTAMLQEAVGSVLGQTYRPIEVIIVDDGSSDDTPEVIRLLASAHPEMRYVLNPHLGAGPARETGRQLARGEFIQYLDSDDRLLPRKFEVQVCALRERPECGAAYGQIRLCPSDAPPLERPFKWSDRQIPTLFPSLLVARWWNTDAPLFRRSVCDEVGPWSDLRYSQDWEYDARVGALGTRLVYCPEFVCEQRLHASTKQTGHGQWLAPADRARFFRSLLTCARRAGVSPETQEMRHFARRVFFHARESGRLGDGQAAQACFEIALDACGGRVPADMRLYRLASVMLGWRGTGRLAAWLEAAPLLAGRRMRLRESWMG